MADLLGDDFAIACKVTLYRCHHKLVAHKAPLFSFLRQRWDDLFGIKFDILLHDLTSTYFESSPTDRSAKPCAPPARFPTRSGNNRFSNAPLNSVPSPSRPCSICTSRCAPPARSTCATSSSSTASDYEIAPTSRKSVTVLFHPYRKLWVLEHSPKLTWPPILGHFTL